jgi:hypothetical protein
MAGLGRKVFTAGDVLTASDVQNYLMDQTVMNFAGTAARSSAIATPTTGMTSYIGVTGTASIPQIEVYTGSAWQTPYGMTLLANVSFTTASAVQIDNVFTSTYDNYRVVFKSSACSATNVSINLRLVNGTSPISTSLYYYAAVGYTATGSLATTVGNPLSSFNLAQSSTSVGDIAAFSADIIDPQIALKTKILWQSYNFNGSTTFSYNGGGEYDESTQVEGLQVFPASGTFSGNIRVYGYRNS